MRVYRERLGVPAWWWLAATITILTIGSMLWAGFSLLIAVIVYAVTGCLTAAALLSWAATIDVSDAGLRAGRRLLPLEQIGEVAALDAKQTRALRFAEADPAAYLIARPYLPRSVYVEVTGRPSDMPYWLIGTRRPERLAAAIEQARSRATGRGPAAVG